MDLLERVPKCYLIIASVCSFFQIIGFLMIFDKTEASDTEQIIEINNINSDDINEKQETLSVNEEVNSIGVKYKNVNEGMDIRNALKQKSFYLLSIIICLFSYGPQIVLGNYKVTK